MRYIAHYRRAGQSRPAPLRSGSWSWKRARFPGIFTCAMKVLRHPRFPAATTARRRANARGIAVFSGSRRRNAQLFPFPVRDRTAFIRFSAGDIKTPQSDHNGQFIKASNEGVHASEIAADSRHAFVAGAARFGSFVVRNGCGLPQKVRSRDSETIHVGRGSAFLVIPAKMDFDSDSRFWRTEKEK